MSIEFGEYVSAHIKRAGFSSQRRFATEVGVSKTTIQRVVRGERGVSPEVAMKLRKPLRMSVDEKVDFHLLSQGYSRIQIESELGRPVKLISEIKPVVTREWHGKKGNSVIKLSY